jgi:GxxExxY protein
MTEDEISYLVRGSIFEVYNHLGPGLLESVYKQALEMSLEKKGLSVRKEAGIHVVFMNQDLGIGFRLDLLVEDKLILEVKSIDELAPVHYKQLLTYLKFTGCKLGLLVNFNTGNIKESIKRVVNGL